jgi:hypothetical protein
MPISGLKLELSSAMPASGEGRFLLLQLSRRSILRRRRFQARDFFGPASLGGATVEPATKTEILKALPTG